MSSSNGKYPVTDESAEPIDPLVERPEEIAQYERATDPYANMLPGISNIRAAETIGRGMEVGKRGNRLILAVSIIMLLALLLPMILAVISHLTQ